MSRIQAIPRRTFLRGAGALMALPMLEAMAPIARAGNDSAVKRFVCVGNPFGFFPDDFFPTETGKNYRLPSLLKPLAAHRKDFTIFSHLDHGLTGGHDACHAFLSGIKVGDAKRHPEGNISLDQKMADWVGGRTRFTSLQLGNGSSMSWTRNGVQVRSDNNLGRIFDALFLDDSADERQKQRLRTGRDGSVLDAVREQAKHFERRLGVRDRERLDQYFTSVRELEKKLRMNAEWIDRPKPKVRSKRPQNTGGQKRDLPLLYELLALALQTDSTRVATAWANGGNLLDDFGLAFSSYHKYSHHGRLPELVAGLRKIEQHQMESLARFLARLQETEDAINGGSLLDHTIVLVGSGLGNGSSHATTDLPILVAGGGFRHGEHKSYPTESRKRVPLNNLYASLLQRFGMEIDRFNNGNGTLPDFV